MGESSPPAARLVAVFARWTVYTLEERARGGVPRASDMDKKYGHARVVSLLALLLERHGELAVRVRAGRGLGADAPVEHGNLCVEVYNLA